MTAPEDIKQPQQGQGSDEDLALSKETLEDLDAPDETAEGAKGGVSQRACAADYSEKCGT